jgi:hypothetical protein
MASSTNGFALPSAIFKFRRIVEDGITNRSYVSHHLAKAGVQGLYVAEEGLHRDEKVQSGLGIHVKFAHCGFLSNTSTALGTFCGRTRLRDPQSTCKRTGEGRGAGCAAFKAEPSRVKVIRRV